MPGVFNGLRIALPVSIIVIVLTEMIGDSRGLGYYIAISGTRFEFANVYAAILVIGDEILSSFINDVLADYRAAVASAGSARDVLEQIVRSTSRTLARHRAALAMLQNDWSYFAAQPRFSYLRTAVTEIERTWVTQLERGQEAGMFRADLDPRLTYRLLRDVLWIPEQWRRTRGYSTDQVVDAFLRILFDGIANRA